MCNASHPIHDCDQESSLMDFLKAVVLEAEGTKIDTYKVISGQAQEHSARAKYICESLNVDLMRPGGRGRKLFV